MIARDTIVRAPRSRPRLTVTINSVQSDALASANIGAVIVDGLGSFPAGHTVSFVVTNPDLSFSALLNDNAGSLAISSSGQITPANDGALTARGNTTLVPRVAVTRLSDRVTSYIDLAIPVTQAAITANGSESAPSTQIRARAIELVGDSIFANLAYDQTTNQNIVKVLNGRAQQSVNYVGDSGGGRTMLTIKDYAKTNSTNGTGTLAIVLMGANGWAGTGAQNPNNVSDPLYNGGTPTRLNVENMAAQIITAYCSAGKRLLFLAPLQAPSDPSQSALDGRERTWLNEYLNQRGGAVGNPFSIAGASTYLKVVNVDAFDNTIHTGTPGAPNTHPNYRGAVFLANLINRELLKAGWIDSNPYPLPSSTLTLAQNTVPNPLMSGTAGSTGTGASGVVADGWNVARTVGTGTAVASKTTLINQTAQRITITGGGTFRLRYANVPISAVEKTAYEAAARIRATTTTSGSIQSIRILTSSPLANSTPEGNQLSGIENTVRTLRTAKQVTVAGQTVATCNLDITIACTADAVLDVAQVYAGPENSSSVASTSGTHYDWAGAAITVAALTGAADADLVAETPGKVLLLRGQPVVAESSYSTYTITGAGGGVTGATTGSGTASTIAPTGVVASGVGTTGATTSSGTAAVVAGSTAPIWNNTVQNGGSNLTYTNGNTTAGRNNTTGSLFYRGSTAISGKIHTAFKVNSAIALTVNTRVGVCDSSVGGSVGGTNGTNVAYHTATGAEFYSGGNTSGLTTIAAGNTVDMEVDTTASPPIVRFAINGGAWIADRSITSLSSVFVFAGIQAPTSASDITIDLLPSSSFAKAITAGFSAL